MTSELEVSAGRRSAKSATAFRTISEVAEDLDVPSHVLRFWETKFSQIRPLKRGGGRRYYRPEDVDLLRRIRQLLYRDGYTIKGVQRLLRDKGDGLDADPPPPPQPAAAPPIPAAAAPTPRAQPALVPAYPPRAEPSAEPKPVAEPVVEPAHGFKSNKQITDLIDELEDLRVLLARARSAAGE
jgi:DNA-binding transcriptional MerR regulator